MMKYLLLILVMAMAMPAYSKSLQEEIDSAPEGATVVLSDGLYEGPIVINKQIVLKSENQGKAVIKGIGKGNVITVKAAGTIIQGLTVTGSGDRHEYLDSCIAVYESDNVAVLDNTLFDCLFGVDFKESNRGRIENNNIQSKKELSLGLKGDGIRLWYSHSNLVRSNHITNVRDVVFWYSSGNKIENNYISGSRYSVHCMYANRNFITNNHFDSNSVGVFIMYSSGSVIKSNKVLNCSEPFGIGVGFKDVSDSEVSNNTLMYNASGLYLDQSPYQPDTTNKFFNNKILYNVVGIQLHGVLFGSIFENNIFDGNMESVSNDTPSTDLTVNRWYKNFWDEYEGLDRDGDGYGDTPYEHRVYADKVMHYLPAVKFFYGSPVMSLLNFLAKLLPFSEPTILATDEMPKVKTEISYEK